MTAVADGRRTELRCPAGPHRLFAMTIQRGERLTFVQPDNLIEFSCYDCRRTMRGEGRDVKRVLHRFNILGELIETVVVDS
jgi:hypothetical protein